jgi:hypothetical protein
VFCFDEFAIDAAAGRVDFHFSHRDARTGVAMARFATAMHVAFPGQAVPRGAAAAALAIGMASLPWLWMGLPTRRILVRAAHLTPAQCAFWTHAYNASLGEFFQLHDLQFPDAIVVECDTTPRPLSPRGAAADGEPLPAASAEAPAGSDASELSDPPRQRRVLIPMGGGKDSLTVWELLRGAEGAPECAWFFLADDRGEYEANWRCALLLRLLSCSRLLCGKLTARCSRQVRGHRARLRRGHARADGVARLAVRRLGGCAEAALLAVRAPLGDAGCLHVLARRAPARLRRHRGRQRAQRGRGQWPVPWRCREPSVRQKPGL